MRKQYAGIDRFRMLAAFLVIAIHTSPLASFSETGDFILTRIIARVAVPFFFMASGFFLLPGEEPCACGNGKLQAFAKKTACIYGAAIMLYLPVNLYNGYFRMENLLPNMIKDVVFDGTMYHLWYLPAAITGAYIAWHLVKRFGYRKAAAVAFILYLIGLFGDSYYGVSKQIPCLNSFYTFIFRISAHTRNGIFFAPLFFVLGGAFAKRDREAETIPGEKTVGKSVCGLGISFILLFVEAMILRYKNMQRHDSMYLFLVPCMCFLFSVILACGERGNSRIGKAGKAGKARKAREAGKAGEAGKLGYRSISMLIYIIHPLVIIEVRLFAKLAGLQQTCVENSIIHFIIVYVISILQSVVCIMAWEQYRKSRKGKMHRSKKFRSEK